jgi:hypothetical protein
VKETDISGKEKRLTPFTCQTTPFITCSLSSSHDSLVSHFPTSFLKHSKETEPKWAGFYVAKFGYSDLSWSFFKVFSISMVE